MYIIDRIYSKVKTLINTDVIGNLKPEEFDRLLHLAILDRYNKLPFDINRFLNKQNRGLNNRGLDNVPERLHAKMLYYLKEATIQQTDAGVYTKPDDCNYLDDIFYTDDESEIVSFEYCKNVRSFNRLKSIAISHTPIFVEVGETFKIAPPTLTTTSTDLDISYLRTPKVPKWTYNLFNNNELFNPDADDFEDADIHPSDEDYIVISVCLLAGMNLKDENLRQFAIQKEVTEFNQEQTN